MVLKNWIVAGLDKHKAQDIAEKCGISGFLALLLVSRGIDTPEKIEDFLRDEGDFFDPFLLIDMDKAVARIEKGIESLEKIAVYGDYDTDGVTATAILYSYLQARGADVIIYIPERASEGFGLNFDAIDKLHEEGVGLIVTVDNGISAIEEVDYAKNLNIDVVITDHHLPPEELPRAVAVVNPRRADCSSPFKEYAGVGVAFKLVSALEGCDQQELLQEYGDILCLGTIADVVPLVSENRAFVKAGLDIINNSPRVGIGALLEVSGLKGKEVSATNLAYTVIPRINAAGRIDCCDKAVKLLITEDEEQARSLARDVESFNRERHDVEAQILGEIERRIAADPAIVKKKVIVMAGEGWQHGVLGIVASRICNKFGRPCILISYEGDTAKGSGRSLEGFSLYDAIESCGHLLVRYGGHTLAAGINLKTENIEAFDRALNEYAAKAEFEMPVPTLNIDLKLNPEKLSLKLAEDLLQLEPFGAGNPVPVFELSGMTVAGIQDIKEKHTRLILARDKAQVGAVLFNCPARDFPYRLGDKVDVAVTIGRSLYLGDYYLSVVVNSIRPYGFDFEKYLHGMRLYDRIAAEEPLSREEFEAIYPSHEDFAVVYRYLRNNGGYRGCEADFFNKLCNDRICICKLAICIDVLEELGLLKVEKAKDRLIIEIKPVEKKVDFKESRILQGLRTRQEVVA